MGGGGISIGRNDDNATLNSGCAIGHGSTGGDSSSDLEGEEGFAAAVVAVEQGDASEGKTFLPEPADGLGLGLGETLVVNGKGDSEFVD